MNYSMGERIVLAAAVLAVGYLAVTAYVPLALFLAGVR